MWIMGTSIIRLTTIDIVDKNPFISILYWSFHDGRIHRLLFNLLVSFQITHILPSESIPIHYSLLGIVFFGLVLHKPTDWTVNRFVINVSKLIKSHPESAQIIESFANDFKSRSMDDSNSVFPMKGVKMKLLKKMKACHQLIDSNWTTRDVCEKFIIPLTRNTKTSFADWLELKGRAMSTSNDGAANGIFSQTYTKSSDGEDMINETDIEMKLLEKIFSSMQLEYDDCIDDRVPDVYICHAWDGNFHDLVNSIEIFMESNFVQRVTTASYSMSRDDMDPFGSTVVWLDLFIFNQWNPLTNHQIEPTPSKALIQSLPTALGEIGHTCVVLSLNGTTTAMSPSGSNLIVPNFLHRMWCLYEIFCAQVSRSEITIQLTEPQQLQLEAHINSDFYAVMNIFNNLDISECKCTNEADRITIMETLQTYEGDFPAVNHVIANIFSEWLQTCVESITKATIQSIADVALSSEIRSQVNSSNVNMGTGQDSKSSEKLIPDGIPRETVRQLPMNANASNHLHEDDVLSHQSLGSKYSTIYDSGMSIAAAGHKKSPEQSKQSALEPPVKSIANQSTHSSDEKNRLPLDSRRGRTASSGDQTSFSYDVFNPVDFERSQDSGENELLKGKDTGNSKKNKKGNVRRKLVNQAFVPMHSSGHIQPTSPVTPLPSSRVHRGVHNFDTVPENDQYLSPSYDNGFIVQSAMESKGMSSSSSVASTITQSRRFDETSGDEDSAAQPVVHAGLGNQLVPEVKGDSLERIGSNQQISKSQSEDFDEKFESFCEEYDNYNQQGVLFHEEGKFDDAEEMFRLALSGYERLLGPLDPVTLGTVNNLAVLLKDRKQYDEAEQMYRRALEGYRLVLGEDELDTLHIINNLAILLKDRKQHKEAEKMYRQALSGYEKMAGQEDAYTLRCIYNLANLLSSDGARMPEQLAEAELLYGRALTGRINTLGELHTSTLRTEYNLANLLSSMGKYEAAELHFQRVLNGRERIIGASHKDTCKTAYNLAEVYRKSNQYNKASQLYEYAFRGHSLRLGPQHEMSIDAKNKRDDMYRRKFHTFK